MLAGVSKILLQLRKGLIDNYNLIEEVTRNQLITTSQKYFKYFLPHSTFVAKFSEILSSDERSLTGLTGDSWDCSDLSFMV